MLSRFILLCLASVSFARRHVRPRPVTNNSLAGAPSRAALRQHRLSVLSGLATWPGDGTTHAALEQWQQAREKELLRGLSDSGDPRKGTLCVVPRKC